MTIAIANTLNMSKEEWLAVRREGIGGSDVAAIAGMSPWKSPMLVYLEKLGELPDSEESEAAKWGKIHEAAIADEFQAQTGFRVQRRNAVLAHDTFPFMLANVDRLFYDPDRGWGVLECKTTSEYNKGEWDGNKAPEGYILQLQHYLAVTGYTFGYLAVLIGGNKYKHILVERDERLIESIIDIERSFWHKVESRTPPEWTGLDCDQELLARLYPETKPEPIELPSEASVLISDYERAAEMEKEAKQLKDAAANKLKALLGDHEVGMYGDRKIKWSTVTRKAYQVAESSYRRLSIA